MIRRLEYANRIILRKLIYSKSIVNINKIHLNNILQKSAQEDCIKVEIRGKILNFPYVWLRDNCQCDECYHETAKSRIIDWSKFNLNVRPKNVVKDDNSVEVTWDDGHKSRYKLSWLKFRSFNPEDQLNYDNVLYKPVKHTWHGDDFQKVCSKNDYHEILESDQALYKWLQSLSTYGVALIKNTPDSETAIDKIVERVAFTRRTHYGVKFVVQHVPNTSNVAYLSSNLQLHIDLPYYEYCPGVNMLHCLVQTLSEGGENLLSDCHYTANYMKTHHREQFKLLTDLEVEWRDVGVEHGNEFYKLHRSPVICLDKQGNITRINYSTPQRSNHFPNPIETVKPWYEAHKLFHDLNHKFAAKFKMQTGDILVFDNIRLLHGRNAYNDNANNMRKLIGAYVDWDEIYSRLRCLKVKLNPEEGV